MPSIEVLKKMCMCEGIGEILAEGAKGAAEKIGKGAEKFAMHVGGELLPMHDPRFTPGWGGTYVSDPTPARHTRGGTQFIESGMVNPEIFIPWGLKDVPPKIEKYDPAGKGEIHALVAARQYLVETSGTCLFAADALHFPFLDLMKAVTGWDLNDDELMKTGKRIATILHAFNLREGFKPSYFTAPPRAAGDPPLKVGSLKDITVDLEDRKKQYYEAMGFDTNTGKIREDIIEALGLQDIIS